MQRTFGLVLLWVGRILILLGVFVMVASLFLPDAVQPLNSIVCPDGTELDNARYTPPNTADDARLELVCTSPTYTESAARPILFVAIVLITLGLISIYFSNGRLHPKYRVPGGPPIT